MNLIKKTLLGLGVMVLIASGGFILWAETPLGPMPEAEDALTSDSSVEVSTGGWLVFKPTFTEPDVGLIIYPGGRVDYRSYAPQARSIATRGYLVVVVRMPLNLAIFGVNSADKVISEFKNIESWALGGHSLGGSMASRFAYKHPSRIEGLILWASYPASGNNLSNANLSVMTIYGTRDGLATPSEINDSLKYLPTAALEVPIEGGNHAQFGWYGEQQGDNEAYISREEQQRQIIEATIKLLESLES